MKYTHELKSGTHGETRLAWISDEPAKEPYVWIVMRSKEIPVPKDWPSYHDDEHVTRLVNRSRLKKIGGVH